ncbi:hypothetical protein HMPREF0281_01675 [Corynebacterium ammoniagenes DSM 20306]|uniref:Uncharacterized protein n=1 Tax=Corynebacterium ammoniagenes DSM 20306 TaxID=649754 RepID=A0ABN0AE32_CORAM|nr:hypothetical protein HMPREF0281_01675 [Corynebacterium ammoniagenes DSM 20306]
MGDEAFKVRSESLIAALFRGASAAGCGFTAPALCAFGGKSIAFHQLMADRA